MMDGLSVINPLGISVVLFTAVGAIWVVVGVLTPPLLPREVEPGDLFISRRADTAYFGKPASELLASDPVLFKFRTLLLNFIAGLFLVSGLLFISVAWFALRHGMAWALVTLGLSEFLVLFIWFGALRPFSRAGVRITFRDLPPFMLMPTVLVVPATILGLVGIVGM